MDYHDMSAIFLQYDEEDAQQEYELFQEAFKEMKETGKSERLEEFLNQRMAQAIPTELTAEEKLDKLYETLVPYLGKMMEYSALKDKYDALGTPEELEELVDGFDALFQKAETLIDVHDAMCLEAEDYEAKGWHIVLVDDKAMTDIKSIAEASRHLKGARTLKLVTEKTQRLFSDDDDEMRELNFLYSVDE